MYGVFYSQAASRIEASGGVSAALGELVEKHMPVIDDARREEMEYYDEEGEEVR
jgi:hypothetical protein